MYLTVLFYQGLTTVSSDSMQADITEVDGKSIEGYGDKNEVRENQ